MKKFVCMLMVAMLVLSMSVTAFARGDSCDACGSMGTVVCKEKTKTIYPDCPYGGTHTVTIYYEVWACRNCGDVVEQTEIDRVISCRYCN